MSCSSHKTLLAHEEQIERSAGLARLAMRIERAASPANGLARAGVANHLSAMALCNFAGTIGRSAMQAPVRIAMWSGPRNISTAMMRAWGNRDDTFVVDEPFYAFYLKKTGADHPGARK